MKALCVRLATCLFHQEMRLENHAVTAIKNLPITFTTLAGFVSSMELCLKERPSCIEETRAIADGAEYDHRIISQRTALINGMPLTWKLSDVKTYAVHVDSARKETHNMRRSNALTKDCTWLSRLTTFGWL